LCLRAGVGSAAATAISAATCRNPALRERFAAVGRAMALEGCSFSDALERSSLSLDQAAMIMELMRTGETTGKTEEAAEHIATVCREEAEARMTQAAILAPNIAYLFLAAYIGYKIISFYGRVVVGPIQELL
jgi:type II secretory pathway component PulF